ncbi:hypothetical protein O1611_g6158 [Lasiodiplodia mahajangana]|uniref:Uncharacterized protein n=1 Tax=Lasiodiplodia mahajangana TaxID=1108764 RepID=A0ACC2JIX2_9PEZI|nr:hypothetical protein O1611_g6158 [Lasiodiplodia mahajangana]
MVKDLNGGEDKDTAFYAGLLVSAYAVAEALTAMGWGALSDRYGRKPIVLIGLGGVAISSLIFGLAETYWVALLARFVGGALNGNVAVMQTMVAEMVKVPEHEPAAYASQPFVWTLGGIIGSAMGGFLAQPATFYPSLFPADGLFGRYPYLLPNLVSVVVIVLAIVQGIIFLEETNPRSSLFHTSTKEATDGEVAVIEDDDVSRADERTPLTRRQQLQGPRISAVGERPAILEEGLPVSVGQSFDIRRTSFGTVHSIQFTSEAQANAASPQATIVEEYTGPTFNFTIIMLTIALVLVAYHQMGFATLLPTHLLDAPAAPPGHLDLIGGLGIADTGAHIPRLRRPCWRVALLYLDGDTLSYMLCGIAISWGASCVFAVVWDLPRHGIAEFLWHYSHSYCPYPLEKRDAKPHDPGSCQWPRHVRMLSR